MILHRWAFLASMTAFRFMPVRVYLCADSIASLLSGVQHALSDCCTLGDDVGDLKKRDIYV